MKLFSTLLLSVVCLSANAQTHKGSLLYKYLRPKTAIQSKGSSGHQQILSLSNKSQVGRYSMAVDSMFVNYYNNGKLSAQDLTKFRYHYYHDGKIKKRTDYSNSYDENGQLRFTDTSFVHLDYDYRKEVLSSLFGTNLKNQDTSVSRITYFNEVGLDTSVYDYNGPVSAMNFTGRRVKTYSPNEKLIKAQVCNELGEILVQYDYTYNTAGYLTSRIEKNTYSTPNLKPRFKEMYSYDNKNNLIKYESASFDSLGNLQPVEATYFYQYNSLGLVSTIDIVRDELVKAIFVYNGDQLTRIDISLKEPGSSTFELVEVDEYSGNSSLSFDNIAYTEALEGNELISYPSGRLMILPNQTSEVNSSFVENGVKSLYNKTHYYYKNYSSGIVSTPVEAVDIFPNPAGDFINLKLENKDILMFKIHNLVGQQVMSGAISGNQIPTSHLKAGQYLITLETKDWKTYTGRFVKE